MLGVDAYTGGILPKASTSDVPDAFTLGLALAVVLGLQLELGCKLDMTLVSNQYKYIIFWMYSRKSMKLFINFTNCNIHTAKL